MLCSADLPTNGRSAAVEAGKRGKAADRQKRRSALPILEVEFRSHLNHPRCQTLNAATDHSVRGRGEVAINSVWRGIEVVEQVEGFHSKLQRT